MRATVQPGSAKRERQQAIRELVARQPVGSQEELAAYLRDRNFAVTQATVSRDIAELGLVKVPRGDRHVYVSPEDLAAPPTPQAPATDESLRRLVDVLPVTVGRSGLILVLVSTPGTASMLAQAIDDSSLQEQEGTLAGDNTLLVLFRDDERLERWLARFRAIQGLPFDARSDPLLALPSRATPHSTEITEASR
jgi:transcriptional regulator of arginine metabolism